MVSTLAAVAALGAVSVVTAAATPVAKGACAIADRAIDKGIEKVFTNRAYCM